MPGLYFIWGGTPTPSGQFGSKYLPKLADFSLFELREKLKMFRKCRKIEHFGPKLLPEILKMSQLIRLWYLSHRRPAKAQVSLWICAVSPELSLFAHMKYGSRRRVWPKMRHLAPVDGCACAFEEWVFGGWLAPWSHELAQLNLYHLNNRSRIQKLKEIRTIWA